MINYSGARPGCDNQHFFVLISSVFKDGKPVLFSQKSMSLMTVDRPDISRRYENY